MHFTDWKGDLLNLPQFYRASSAVFRRDLQANRRWLSILLYIMNYDVFSSSSFVSTDPQVALKHGINSSVSAFNT